MCSLSRERSRLDGQILAPRRLEPLARARGRAGRRPSTLDRTTTGAARRATDPEEDTVTGLPVEPQNDDANADDGQKWDQVLKGEDYDLDADGDVDADVAQHPSPDQV